MDLTKIEKPFGLLDKETQDALRADGGPFEMYLCGGWREVVPTWVSSGTYRVKPKPLTKPSINWSHVAPEYKYLATDEGGTSWLYANKPIIYGGYWKDHTYRGCVQASTFASFRPGTCDWRDSLVKRPDEGCDNDQDRYKH